MGYDVHIHVCFACDRNDGVAALAAARLSGLPNENDGHAAARWFLESLAERTGGNAGPKGGLSLWGMVGNYTNGDDFVEVLRPFWTDLLSGVPGGPLPFERVMVFVEHEQSDAATAYQIGVEDPEVDAYQGGHIGPASSTHVITIRKHARLPFAWGQM